MKTFDYVRPRSISDAIAAATEPGAAYLAVGTNLLDLMKGGITRPNRLVDVTRLPGLDRIERLPEGGIRIGAGLANSFCRLTSHMPRLLSKSLENGGYLRISTPIRPAKPRGACDGRDPI